MKSFYRETGAIDNAGGNTAFALTGTETAEKIAEWKKKFPDGVYGLESDGSMLYFKVPGRKEINAALSAAKNDDSNPLAYMEELTHMTCIGGDKSKLDDYQALQGLMQEVKLKAEGKKAKLVNL